MTSASGALAGCRCIALVGAGGKTSLAWTLMQHSLDAGQRAIYTTTTHTLLPADGAFDRVLVEPDAARAARLLAEDRTWRSAWLAAAVVGGFEGEIHSAMPLTRVKAKGYAPDAVRALAALDAVRIVEADGALRRWIKAPADHEPVLPPELDAVIVVACLDALGQLLDARIAHRPERVAEETGLRLGERLTAAALVALLCSPGGGLKGVTGNVRRIAALSRLRAPRERDIEAALRAHGFDAVLDYPLVAASM